MNSDNDDNETPVLRVRNEYHFQWVLLDGVKWSRKLDSIELLFVQTTENVLKKRFYACICRCHIYNQMYISVVFTAFEVHWVLCHGQVAFDYICDS